MRILFDALLICWWTKFIIIIHRPLCSLSFFSFFFLYFRFVVDSQSKSNLINSLPIQWEMKSKQYYWKTIVSACARMCVGQFCQFNYNYIKLIRLCGKELKKENERKKILFVEEAQRTIPNIEMIEWMNER